MISLAFGLLDIREDKKLTQKQLAKKLSVSQQTVAKWECGKSEPTLKLFTRICRLYDYPPEMLLDVSPISGADYALMSRKEQIEYIKESKDYNE